VRVRKYCQLPKDLFARWIKHVWNIKKEQVIYEQGVKEKIIEYTENLLTDYNNSIYPIIHRGYRDVLTRISVAYACMHISFSEDRNNVLILPEHVELAYQFITEMLLLLGYDAYIHALYNETTIKAVELEQTINSLEPIHKSILKEIALNINEDHNSTQLAKKLGVISTTIRRYYDKLLELGLIETSKGKGIKIKAKGSIVVKHLVKADGQEATKGQQEIRR